MSFILILLTRSIVRRDNGNQEVVSNTELDQYLGNLKTQVPTVTVPLVYFPQESSSPLFSSSYVSRDIQDSERDNIHSSDKDRAQQTHSSE